MATKQDIEWFSQFLAENGKDATTATPEDAKAYKATQQNTVTLESGETTILSDAQKKMQEINLQNTAIDTNKQVEPVQPIQPVVETPKPVEQKTVDPVVVETPEPVEQKTVAPVKPIQTESEKIAEFQAKDGLMKQKEAEALTGFKTLMESGAKNDTLAKYVNENSNYRNLFNVQASLFYQNKKTFDFQQKYATATPEQLYSAVLSSDVVPWTKEWNKLPLETRQAYNDYKKKKDITLTSEEIDTSLGNDQTKIIDSSPLQDFWDIFSPQISTKRKELENSPEYTNLRTETSAKLNEVKDLKRQLDDVEVDTKALYEWKGKTAIYVNAKIAEAQKQLGKKYNTALDEYNTSLATFQDMKSDIDTQVADLKYENEIARQKYQMDLAQYNTDRSRMDTFKMFELQEQSKELATQRQEDFQREMTKIEQDFAVNNQKPTYQIGRDGKMYAILDGKATAVKTLEGDLLFWEDTPQYSSDIRYNNDGTITEVKTFKDGSPTSISTFDVQGSKVTWTPDALSDVINKCRVTGQCAEGTYDYLVNMWVKDVNGSNIRFGNSFWEKQRLINSKTPTVWAVAIWNPVQWSGVKGYWHTGIITGVNTEKWTVTLTDWNWNGDEKMRTNAEVPLSSITSTWGFMDLQKPIDGVYKPQQVAQYKEYDIPLYKAFNSDTGLTSAEQKAIPNYEQFKKEALAYWKEIAKPWYTKIENLISLAESLKGKNPLERLWPDTRTDFNRLTSKAGMQELITLKQQGATFGALSEKEFERIQESIIKVWPLTSAEKFDEYLDEYIETLKVWLPSDYELPSIQKPQNTAWSIDDYYKVKTKYNTTWLPQ